MDDSTEMLQQILLGQEDDGSDDVRRKTVEESLLQYALQTGAGFPVKMETTLKNVEEKNVEEPQDLGNQYSSAEDSDESEMDDRTDGEKKEPTPTQLEDGDPLSCARAKAHEARQKEFGKRKRDRSQTLLNTTKIPVEKRENQRYKKRLVANRDSAAARRRADETYRIALCEGLKQLETEISRLRSLRDNLISLCRISESSHPMLEDNDPSTQPEQA